MDVGWSSIRTPVRRVYCLPILPFPDESYDLCSPNWDPCFLFMMVITSIFIPWLIVLLIGPKGLWITPGLLERTGSNKRWPAGVLYKTKGPSTECDAFGVSGHWMKEANDSCQWSSLGSKLGGRIIRGRLQHELVIMGSQANELS